MRVLVTGSGGLVGAAVVEALAASGHAVVPYDLINSQDILDPPALREAVRGCDSVVHAAALLGEPGDTPGRIMEVNLLGTWNVLCAAREAGVRRFLFLSSVDALGVFKGEHAPDYLPLDDAHPCYAATPYAISKRLGEDMCRLVAGSGDLTVVCLRPPGVWTPDTYAWIESERAARTAFEWDPFWEYGAFLDIRDLSNACLRGLTCRADGFRCVLVASSDITTSGRTSRDLAQFVHPDLEWRGGAEFDEEPFHTLVDIEPARQLLDWTPRYTWRAHLEGAHA
ncbi:MAG: NAD(P)-dependent oxidoreductase [Candidatus Latescibacteria bacterium]|nr:NAD-dependent dehydratase [Gemmatimonadaceae bacterium]MDP6017679.1 NAD(P)-dependent oxidoreductase [Candidatus Latescibacterota bacterium]